MLWCCLLLLLLVDYAQPPVRVALFFEGVSKSLSIGFDTILVCWVECPTFSNIRILEEQS